MASFMEELWNSILTPGATPTLLIAANVTFAALQILLAALLAATRSIHFVILSALCGGLWWSINWFAQELKAAQEKEAEAEKLRQRKKGEGNWRSKGEVEDSADDEGEDTEVEDAKAAKNGDCMSAVGTGRGQAGNARTATTAVGGPTQVSKGTGSTTSSQQSSGKPALRQRPVDEGDRSGEISTDSEWEKVSEQGDR